MENTEEEIERILTNMGIKYDPLVVTALNDYATRIAGDILCDARDYANHRGAGPDLDVSDVKLATKLSTAYSARALPVEASSTQVQELINRVPLANQVNKEDYVLRYPKQKHPLVDVPDMVTGLLQRTYTLIPSNATGSNNTMGVARERSDTADSFTEMDASYSNSNSSNTMNAVDFGTKASTSEKPTIDSAFEAS